MCVCVSKNSARSTTGFGERRNMFWDVSRERERIRNSKKFHLLDDIRNMIRTWCLTQMVHFTVSQTFKSKENVDEQQRVNDDINTRLHGRKTNFNDVLVKWIAVECCYRCRCDKYMHWNSRWRYHDAAVLLCVENLEILKYATRGEVPRER